MPIKFIGLELTPAQQAAGEKLVYAMDELLAEFYEQAVKPRLAPFDKLTEEQAEQRVAEIDAAIAETDTAKNLAANIAMGAFTKALAVYLTARYIRDHDLHQRTQLAPFLTAGLSRMGSIMQKQLFMHAEEFAREMSDTLDAMDEKDGEDKPHVH